MRKARLLQLTLGDITAEHKHSSSDWHRHTPQAAAPTGAHYARSRAAVFQARVLFCSAIAAAARSPECLQTVLKSWQASYTAVSMVQRSGNAAPSSHASEPSRGLPSPKYPGLLQRKVAQQHQAFAAPRLADCKDDRPEAQAGRVYRCASHERRRCGRRADSQPVHGQGVQHAVL